jgi:aminoglycoside/choline kinase family phosphotransferase
MNDREKGAQDFLARVDSSAAMHALHQDASNRRYYRLTGTKHPLLLMDCPPGLEDLGQFVKVANFLSAVGLGVPTIYEMDESVGYAVIEDFGTDTFTSLLNQSGDRHDSIADDLYRMAIDTLVCLHKQVTEVPKDYPDYLPDQMAEAACLMLDWYIPELSGQVVSSYTRAAYKKAWFAVLSRVSEDTTLVLRDYHVDNLMLRKNQQGVSRCGVIDFQDAACGPRMYDLASLLEDARRPVNRALKESMQQYYAAQMGIEINAEFTESFVSLAAQRHSRVAGVFVRLAQRDKREHYLQYLPLVISMLADAVDDPVLEEPRSILDTLCPTWRDPKPLLA